MGDDIVEWAGSNAMKISNSGSATYEYKDRVSGGVKLSVPDVTLSSDGLMIKCWAPMDPTSSDHHPIIFQMAIADDATLTRMRTF